MIPLGLTTNLVILGGDVATTAVLTGIAVHEHVSTKYQNILLKQEVAVRTIERKVEVLDKKTLTATLVRERAKWEREQKAKEVIDEIIERHQDSPVLWCVLSPDELQCWNDENANLLDHSCLSDGREEKLPRTAPGDGRGSD